VPTTNPRINVTLAPSTHAMVEKLAKIQRCSKSTVLRELLEASEPSLAQALAMMEAANELGSQARNKVAKDMEATLKEVERKGLAAMELAAGITTDLVSQAEAIRGRRPPRRAPAVGASSRRASGGRRPQDPPSSNRGVKS
jgi:hypothetical protein